MSVEDQRRAAAHAALAELPTEGVIGLGTGSTTAMFLDALAPLIAAGRRLVGVPTSEATRARATALGIPLLADSGPWQIDVTVDGADEVDPRLDLLKGRGAAHTREKIVNVASALTVIIVDTAKWADRLGERVPIPIEVLVFGHGTTATHLARFGDPTLRRTETGPIVTDTGGYIYDLAVQELRDPRALDAELHAIPGVVETGLFLGRADVVLVGSDHGVERLTRLRR